MKIINTIIVTVTVLLFFGQNAHSADTEGLYWTGGGVGAVKCPQFVASMEKARSLGIGSVEFATELQGFYMFLAGFETGYNMSTADTCQIFPDAGNKYSLLSWAENYCRINASTNFANAVIALSKDRYPRRQRICPKYQ